MFVQADIISKNRRNYLTKMCEWDKWRELVERLKEHGEYERAACICVFNDDLQRAIEILISNKNSSKNGKPKKTGFHVFSSFSYQRLLRRVPCSLPCAQLLKGEVWN
jgi:hypothetical protein